MPISFKNPEKTKVMIWFDRRTQHFPYADFANTLLCREHYQSQQSQAGNYNGQRSKQNSKAGYNQLVAVQLLIFFINKLVSDGVGGVNIFINLLDAVKRSFGGNTGPGSEMITKPKFRFSFTSIITGFIGSRRLWVWKSF